MYIARFQEVKFRVPNPQRPGTSVWSRRFERVSGVSIMSHNDAEYVSNEDGWFDVPQDVAEFWLRRPGWKTTHEAHADVIAGFIHEDVAAPAKPAAEPKTRRTRSE